MTQFGFANGAAAANDRFDLRQTPSGGFFGLAKTVIGTIDLQATTLCQLAVEVCMAEDSVGVKDKVRKRRQHDDDRYTDKRAHGDDER